MEKTRETMQLEFINHIMRTLIRELDNTGDLNVAAPEARDQYLEKSTFLISELSGGIHNILVCQERPEEVAI